MLTHLLRQDPHADTGEVVDRETRVTRFVGREDAGEARTKDLIFQAFLQRRHTKCFGEILEQNLDEDSATGRGLVFVEMHHTENVPAYGFGS